MSFNYPSMTQPLASAHKKPKSKLKPITRLPARSPSTRPPPKRVIIDAQPDFDFLDKAPPRQSSRPGADLGVASTSVARYRPSQRDRRLERAGADEDDPEDEEDPFAGLRMVSEKGKNGLKKFRVEDSRLAEDKELRRREKEEEQARPTISHNFRQRFSPPRAIGPPPPEYLTQFETGIEPELEFEDDKPRLFELPESVATRSSAQPSPRPNLASLQADSAFTNHPPQPRDDWSPEFQPQPELHYSPSVSSSHSKPRLGFQLDDYLRHSPPAPAQRGHFRPVGFVGEDGLVYEFSTEPVNLAPRSHPGRVQATARPRALQHQLGYHSPAAEVGQSGLALTKQNLNQAGTFYSSSPATDLSADDNLYATNPRQPFVPAPAQPKSFAGAPLDLAPPARVGHPEPSPRHLQELEAIRARLHRARTTHQYFDQNEWDGPLVGKGTPAPLSDPPAVSPDGQDQPQVEHEGQMARMWHNPARPPLAQASGIEARCSFELHFADRLQVQGTPSRPPPPSDKFLDKLKRQAGQHPPLRMHNSLGLDKVNTQLQPTIPPDDSTSTQHNDEPDQPGPTVEPAEPLPSTPVLQSRLEQQTRTPLFRDPSPAAESVVDEAERERAEVEQILSEVLNGGLDEPNWDQWDDEDLTGAGEGGAKVDEQLFPNLGEHAQEDDRDNPSPSPAKTIKRSQTKPVTLVLPSTPEAVDQDPVAPSATSARPQPRDDSQPGRPKAAFPPIEPAPALEPYKPPVSPATFDKLMSLEMDSDEDGLLADLDDLCEDKGPIVPRRPPDTSTEASEALAREAEEDDATLRKKKRARRTTGSSELRTAALEELKDKRARVSSGSERRVSSTSGDKGEERAGGRTRSGMGSSRDGEREEGGKQRKRKRVDKAMGKAVARLFMDVEAEVEDDSSEEEQEAEIAEEEEGDMC